MRAYRLLIYDENGLPLYNLQQGTNDNNGMGLKIEFNLQYFSGGINTNTNIKITNLQNYFQSVLASNKLKNAYVELYAGLNNSPLLQKSGINPTIDEFRVPIYRGYVRGVYPEQQGPDSVVNLLLTQVPVFGAESKSGIFNLTEGVSLSSQFTAGLTEAFSGVVVIDVTNLTGSSTRTVPITYKSPIDLINKLIKEFPGITFNFEGKRIVISDVPIVNPEIKIITAADMTQQPQIGGIAKVLVNLHLSSRYRPNDIIILPSDIFVAATGLDELIGGNDIVGDLQTYVAGSWRVVTVWHRGISTDSGGGSWTTTLECIQI